MTAGGTGGKPRGLYQPPLVANTSFLKGNRARQAAHGEADSKATAESWIIDSGRLTPSGS